MTKTLCLILGDQLSESLEIVRQANREQDTLLLCEVMEEATYVPHHPQKIALVFGAMRHFASYLSGLGYWVRYVGLEDANNTGTFEGEVRRAIAELDPQRVRVTEPGEYRVLEKFLALQRELPVPLEILPDTRFLCSREEFARWAQGRKQLRMEYFYRDMRRRHHILMDDAGEPVGGRWNYDEDNRAVPDATLHPPPRPVRKLSPIGQEVLDLVKRRFAHHFGTLEGFAYVLTREQALEDLDFFITHGLGNFGTYQDAMLHDQPYLYHSVLSAYLNIGLLVPLEVCQRAEQAYRQGLVPLNSAEGFIRQILGWREYVRGIYWSYMPEYARLDFLEARRKLPALYWGQPTAMACLKGAVAHTREHAYSHHIQRLMLTGNFALLAGLDVAEVQAWYLAVYADAFEWVEMPNTLGMALFADGGRMASKPYAASGKYINKMSDYCRSCRYNPNHLLEADACPFNALYWDFVARHRSRLAGNQRMTYVYATLDKMTEAKRRAIGAKAADLFARLERDEL